MLQLALSSLSSWLDLGKPHEQVSALDLLTVLGDIGNKMLLFLFCALGHILSTFTSLASVIGRFVALLLCIL